MILYISGFKSKYKDYIFDVLTRTFPNETVHYYVLVNKFSTDYQNLTNIINENKNIYIIGHSTGAFLGLCLYRIHTTINSVHCINPAIDLIFSLKKHPDSAEILSESNDINLNFLQNDLFYKKIYPINLYQGVNDDQVNVEYNKLFFRRIVGKQYFYNIGHKFTEYEFIDILNDIKKYIY